MAVEAPLFCDGSMHTAGADLSTGLSGSGGSGQFLAVKTTAAHIANLANTGGERIAGIVQNKPKLGEAVNIAMAPSVTKAVVGAAWTAGQVLMTDTSARLIPQTGTNAGVAIAIESATVVGSLATVRLI
jgi:hypothetical protein